MVAARLVLPVSFRPAPIVIATGWIKLLSQRTLARLKAFDIDLDLVAATFPQNMPFKLFFGQIYHEEFVLRSALLCCFFLLFFHHCPSWPASGGRQHHRSLLAERYRLNYSTWWLAFTYAPHVAYSFAEKYMVYSLRQFYAVNAVRNGVGVFEMVRDMSTSVQMIQEYYG
ncbi:hypothetical protein SE91_02630 [Bradyrhizobium sp. DOA1]|nr:hypothetical protein SE91_02630 [Bradyrhizobium sp. DOA1]